jgi:hypothetical protein
MASVNSVYGAAGGGDSHVEHQAGEHEVVTVHIDHGWPIPKWQLEALELFLQPGAFLSGLALFLIPYGADTTQRKVQGLMATVCTFFYIAFVLLVISIRIRTLKAGNTDQDLPAKGTAIAAFVIFSCDLFAFCVSFLLYYAQYSQHRGDAFWWTIGISFFLVAGTYFVMCWHYFAGAKRVGPIRTLAGILHLSRPSRK